MTRLLKTTKVLNRVKVLDKAPDGPPRSETFVQENEETREMETFVTLLRQTWQDLGSPDQITIAVEAGDTLHD